MLEQDFEKLIEKAIVSLPEHIQKAMDNVAIVVEKRPSPYDLRKTGTKIGNSLLGLYQGVPKTSWGRSFGQILPDKITIFREPIESLASSVTRASAKGRDEQSSSVTQASAKGGDEQSSSVTQASAKGGDEQSSSIQEIAELIRIVVWHEIAYHLGFSEKKVRELERKWRKIS